MSHSSILDNLLRIGAIHLANNKPYQWASGWLSPIYCDNRLALSDVTTRTLIAEGLVEKICQLHPDCGGIIAVATGGIAWGAIVAQRLSLPLAYVRPSAKSHGLGNRIEGRIPGGTKVVILEDLISTGGSSLSAAESVRAEGIEVLGMVAIFTYDFPQAKENFSKHKITLNTLESYPHLLEYLLEQGQLTAEKQTTLEKWRQSPESWGK